MIYPVTDRTFDEWKQEVSNLFIHYFGGLTPDDLPDAPYRDWFDACISPEDMVEEYVENYDDTGLMAELYNDAQERKERAARMNISNLTEEGDPIRKLEKEAMDIQQTVDHYEKELADIYKEHGEGVRPSYVSADIAWTEARIKEAKACLQNVLNHIELMQGQRNSQG